MKIKKILLVVCCLAFVNQCLSQTCLPSSNVVGISETPECFETYILVFEDNFDGNQLNTTTWELPTYMQGTLETHNSQEYNTLDNIHLSNGYLYITAKKETIEALCVSWLGPDVILDDGRPNLRTYNYTSSCIQTKEKYLYGKFEIRCKIPKGSFWPSFWLFGDWDEFGKKDWWNEIDVFEFRRGENKPSSNVHYDIYGDGNSESCPESHVFSINFSETYNTFTLIWDEYSIKWFLNGICFRTLNYYSNYLGQSVGCEGIIAPGVYFIENIYGFNPMQLILNLPVEKYNSEDEIDYTPADSDLPADYIIDYVRIWQKQEQNCCVSHKIFEATEDLPSFTSVEDYIKAGFDAGISDISGGVKVKSGQNITFRAGDFIELSGGFTVEAGANFTAEIGECIISQGENIEITNFPNSFSPDDDGVQDKLFIHVKGATHYKIRVEGKNWPYNTFFSTGKIPIYSNPVAVWDGSCNYTGNCWFYTKCNKERRVIVSFYNCDNNLISQKLVTVDCNTKSLEIVEDNSIHFSNENVLRADSICEIQQFFIHPNPFDNSFTITLTQTEDSETEIYLTNTFGRKVLQIYSGQLEKGQHAIEVSDASLPSGMYFCIMQTPTQRKVLKVVKM